MTAYPLLKTRIFFAVLLSGLGIAELVQAGQAQLVGRALTGVALILLGAHAFLQPPALTARLREMVSASQANAIGSVKLRTTLSFTALGFLWMGLLLRYVVKL